MGSSSDKSPAKDLTLPRTKQRDAVSPVVSGLSDYLGVEQLLTHARERESEYDWLGAFECYKKALGAMSKMDYSRIGELEERSGYAVYRAAMQAESRDEFNERLPQALVHYESGLEFYEKLNDPRASARLHRCRAMITFLGSWMVLETAEKKNLLEDAWRSAKESLKHFEEAGDYHEFGRTYNQISITASFVFALEWDPEGRRRLLEEAVKLGEKAIQFLSSLEVHDELARAYTRTATYLDVYSFPFLDLDEREEYSQRVRGFFQKANEISEKIALLELSNYVLLGVEPFLWEYGTDRAVTI